MTAESPAELPAAVTAPLIGRARFAPGDIVRHRMFDFRGVVFDIDPVFANTDEWYEAIPEELRPPKEQPFYHLLAENGDSSYIAYVSQQNLVADGDGGPIDHPEVETMFDGLERGRYRIRAIHRH
jgi:heat shock protein HspQ